jgi:hypothetical protein
MVDFILDLYQKLHNTEEVPQGTHHCLFILWRCIQTLFFFFKLEFAEKRENVLGQMEDLREKAQKVMDVLEKPEVIAALRQDKVQNFQYLKENYNVSFFFCFGFLLVDSNNNNNNIRYAHISLLRNRSIPFMNSVNSNTTVVIMEVLPIIFIISVFW